MFVQPIRETHVVPFCYRFVTVLLPFWCAFGPLFVMYHAHALVPDNTQHGRHSSFGVQSEPIALIEVVPCGTTLPLFLSANRIDSLRGHPFLFDRN
jgi:hypothetical protein